MNEPTKREAIEHKKPNRERDNQREEPNKEMTNQTKEPYEGEDQSNKEEWIDRGEIKQKNQKRENKPIRRIKMEIGNQSKMKQPN